MVDPAAADPGCGADQDRLTSPAFREKRAKTEDARFDVWTEEVTALLRAEHMERRNGETPMAFARRVDESGLFSESVSPAAECLSTVRYSAAETEGADTGLMRDTAMLLRGELSQRGRAVYLLRRILPRKRTRNR